MSQPDYVPVRTDSHLRGSDGLPPADPWYANRPAEVVSNPQGARFGIAGPDQGYGLKLVRRFAERLDLGELHLDDALTGGLVVGLKRASHFGRAPVVYDFEFAFSLFGLLGAPPAELVNFRNTLFAQAAHDYGTQRAIADIVPRSTLHMTPTQIRADINNWRQLLQYDTALTVAIRNRSVVPA